MLELISVHVTKCAGTSFKTALLNGFPENSVQLLYDDNPANPISKSSLDPVGAAAAAQTLYDGLSPDTRVLHGHFHVAKFRCISRAVPRFTILRHPVDRAISHYMFFRQNPDKPTTHPIMAYLHANNLSIPQFCRLPHITHFYRKAFFGGVSRSEFDYVGRFEALDETVRQLSTLIGRPLAIPHENVGWLRQQQPPVDDGMRRDLTEILKDDIDFYRDWTAA